MRPSRLHAIAAVAALLASIAAGDAQAANVKLDPSGKKAVEISGMSPSPDCSTAASRGKVTKVDWAAPPNTPGFNFADDKFGDSYINIELDTVGASKRAAVMAALRDLIQPGKRLTLVVKGCGAGAGVEKLDSIKAGG